MQQSFVHCRFLHETTPTTL